MTGAKLRNKQLTPNNTVRSLINCWKEKKAQLKKKAEEKVNLSARCL